MMKMMNTLSRCLMTVLAVTCLTGCGTDAIKLRQGQALLIQSPDGNALIKFTNFGDKEGVSTYKWRYRAVAAAKTDAGEGKVYEKFDATTVVPGFHKLHNEGSQIKVTAGPIQVDWSYGCSGAYGWIYPGTNSLLIKVLDGVAFESYDP